jgi:hypothetical protein
LRRRAEECNSLLRFDPLSFYTARNSQPERRLRSPRHAEKRTRQGQYQPVHPRNVRARTCGRKLFINEAQWTASETINAVAIIAIIQFNAVTSQTSAFWRNRPQKQTNYRAKGISLARGDIDLHQ